MFCFEFCINKLLFTDNNGNIIGSAFGFQKENDFERKEPLGAVKKHTHIAF